MLYNNYRTGLAKTLFASLKLVMEELWNLMKYLERQKNFHQCHLWNRHHLQSRHLSTQIPLSQSLLMRLIKGLQNASSLLLTGFLT